MNGRSILHAPRSSSAHRERAPFENVVLTMLEQVGERLGVLPVFPEDLHIEVSDAELRTDLMMVRERD